MPQRKQHPKVIIISGPTGAGQDTVIRGLKGKIEFAKVITTTSRLKREGEVEGRDYYFVTPEAFHQKIKKGEMMEWKEVYGEYKGISKKAFEDAARKNLPMLFKVDWQGTLTLKKEMPYALSIGIKPPSLEVIRKRLMKRQKDAEAVLAQRLAQTADWMKRFDIYDAVVVNEEGKPEETIEKVEEIIRKYLKEPDST